MDIITILVPMIVGLIVGYIFGVKSAATKAPIDTEELKNSLSATQGENLELKTQISRLEEQIRGTRENFESKLGENAKLQSKLEDQNQMLSALNAEKTSLLEKLSFEKSRHEEHKASVEKLQEKFQKDFSIVAQGLLEQNAKKLSETNQEKIKDLLGPLGENLEQFKKQISEDRKENLSGRAELKSMIEQFQKQNENISIQAKNLVDALKGDVKKQGNWGEVILERILEHSGLRKGIEYDTQKGYKDSLGNTLLPDAVINLPDNKKVIVDSKVSLKAYEAYVSAESKDEQVLALKSHVQSVRAHMKGLSDKNYFKIQELEGLDFVLMFLPVEPAFSLLFQEDQPLYLEALEKNIVIVSPSTLLATLRTIHSIWKQEQQSQNALDIANRAGALYDKFEGFVVDLEKVGDHLDKAQKTHQSAFNKLSKGRGNLLGQVEKLKNLGAKATKQIDRKLLDESDSNE